MKTNTLIEAYVTDVATQLPRAQRNDVAFELRALLSEQLQDKADEVGRAPDDAMTMELLRAFGRPAEVAARYRPALVIIDPADGHSFLRWSVLGLAVIWGLSLAAHLSQPIASSSQLLAAVGHWWASTAIPSLWWPGLLVVGYSAAAWTRRRWPDRAAWTPQGGDYGVVNRTALALAIVAIACGVFALSEPRWLLDLFFDGRAAPQAYEALTYTDDFKSLQAPWLLGLLLLNIPLLAVALVQGRWSPRLRYAQDVHGLVLVAVMLWILLDGPAFQTAPADNALKFALLVSVVFSLGALAFKWWRRVKPQPGAATA